jgi:pyruvate,water dikinase
MMNVGNPDEALSLSTTPNCGIGLARLEFIIANIIRVHPLALIYFDRLDDLQVKAEITKMTQHYANKSEFFVDRLASGIAMIAAAFHPNPVIVRMSDFKTNEYANLLGGRQFEPKEENPMIGWRGASRYYDPKYREGFALECKAFIKVRK